MVSSIRYWLLASQMAINHESEGMMSTDIGDWIYENDPYIEDEETAPPLQFPSNLTSIMEGQVEEKIDERRVIDDVALSIPAKTGRLIMFQSHIYHQVPICKNNKPRYFLIK